LILRAIVVAKRCQQWALSVNKSFTTTRAEMIHPSAMGPNRDAGICDYWHVLGPVLALDRLYQR
jgi:hypothetical protein